jgi:hypothetical protein
MKSHLNTVSQKSLVIARLVFTSVFFFTGLMMAQAVDEETGYTDNFLTDYCTFVDEGEATYYILKPGYQLVFEGTDEGITVLFVHTVLDETRNSRCRGTGMGER